MRRHKQNRIGIQQETELPISYYLINKS